MRLNKQFKIGLLLVITIFVGLFAFYLFTIKQSTSSKATNTLSDISIAKQEDFNKCVILHKENAELMIDKQSISFNYSDIEKELPNKLKDVNDLNIILTKDANYQNLITVLDAVVMSGMKKYKLLKK
jgi:biopolymer transport protein ExbD